MSESDFTHILPLIHGYGGIPVIMGPTASGKTALAIALAEQYNGEIISADSMQFYRGVNIGSAKPSPEELQRVPHHLIDSMDISEKSDIYRFRADSIRIIAEIQTRGHLPVIAGGSGLYLHALIYGLDDLPNNPELRSKLDAAYDNPEHFHELQTLMAAECPDDYVMFAGHSRRLIRAREVFLLTGKQFSELRRGCDKPNPAFMQFVICRNRDELKIRIRKRTEIMLKSGWIEEAKTLIKRNILHTPTAWQAIGYTQINDYLNGLCTYEEMEDRIVIATRQYARRQITWFKNKHPESIPLNF